MITHSQALVNLTSPRTMPILNLWKKSAWMFCFINVDWPKAVSVLAE